MELSFVIPAYNEAERLPASFTELETFFRDFPYSTEIIVVDDGSRDRTADVVRAAAPRFESPRTSLRLVQNPGNRGKGYSVRHGFQQSRGTVVLFSDADLSTPLGETLKIVEPILGDRFDVVFGSRDLPESKIGVHQSPFREFAGRAFNRVMRLMTGLPFADTQCGFKAFHREKMKRVFELQTIEGFAFDVEILYLAKKFGARMNEVPVEWNHVEGSKVGINSGSVRAFADIAGIRWRDLRGKYKKEKGPV